MSSLLVFAFIVALAIYLGIAGHDIRYHYTLDGTDREVAFAETLLHLSAGSLVTLMLVLLLFGDLLSVPAEARQLLLSVAPIALTVVGLVDEFAFHRPRCRNDALENWHHAVLHLSMGSTLVIGYARWY